VWTSHTRLATRKRDLFCGELIDAILFALAAFDIAMTTVEWGISKAVHAPIGTTGVPAAASMSNGANYYFMTAAHQFVHAPLQNDVIFI
jgi:hypothetical protein